MNHYRCKYYGKPNNSLSLSWRCGGGGEQGNTNIKCEKSVKIENSTNLNNQSCEICSNWKALKLQLGTVDTSQPTRRIQRQRNFNLTISNQTLDTVFNVLKLQRLSKSSFIATMITWTTGIHCCDNVAFSRWHTPFVLLWNVVEPLPSANTLCPCDKTAMARITLMAAAG